MSWYDNNENWYKPNYSQPAPVQSAVQRPQAKLPGNRRTRIIALILCAVLLLGGIVYSVLEADWSDSGTDEDGMPKSYMTYFEDYYASASKTPSSIKLEKVADRGSLTLQTGSSGAAKLSYNEIFQKCSPCVVGIKSFDGKSSDSYSWGSGIVVSSDGYILTNTHVIDEGERATVQLYDGTTFDAKLVAADSQSDVAILKIEKTGLTPAVFASSKNIQTGDEVCAIGNPLSPDYSLTMTSGIISATSREVSYNGAVMNLLQTDTSINEGNSGGPLINVYGQVVGINTMKMGSSSTTSVEGLGFAIPIASTAYMINDLIAYGEVHGEVMIGISVQPVPVTAENGESALLVMEVTPGGPGEEAGIQEGDLIVAADGEALTKSTDLLRVRRRHEAGETLKLLVERDGKRFTADVVLREIDT